MERCGDRAPTGPRFARLPGSEGRNGKLCSLQAVRDGNGALWTNGRRRQPGPSARRLTGWSWSKGKLLHHWRSAGTQQISGRPAMLRPAQPWMEGAQQGVFLDFPGIVVPIGGPCQCRRKYDRPSGSKKCSALRCDSVTAIAETTIVLACHDHRLCRCPNLALYPEYNNASIRIQPRPEAPARMRTWRPRFLAARLARAAWAWRSPYFMPSSFRPSGSRKNTA